MYKQLTYVGTLVFPALKRLGQQDSKSEISLGSIMRPFSKTEVQTVLYIIKYMSL